MLTNYKLSVFSLLWRVVWVTRLNTIPSATPAITLSARWGRCSWLSGCITPCYRSTTWPSTRRSATPSTTSHAREDSVIHWTTLKIQPYHGQIFVTQWTDSPVQKSYTVKYEHEVKKKCHVYHEESCHGWDSTPVMEFCFYRHILDTDTTRNVMCIQGKSAMIFLSSTLSRFPWVSLVTLSYHDTSVTSSISYIIRQTCLTIFDSIQFNFKEECHDVPKTHCRKIPIQVSVS